MLLNDLGVKKDDDDEDEDVYICSLELNNDLCVEKDEEDDVHLLSPPPLLPLLHCPFLVLFHHLPCLWRFISTEGALRIPMTSDNHPIQPTSESASNKLR